MVSERWCGMRIIERAAWQNVSQSLCPCVPSNKILKRRSLATRLMSHGEPWSIFLVTRLFWHRDSSRVAMHAIPYFGSIIGLKALNLEGRLCVQSTVLPFCWKRFQCERRLWGRTSLGSWPCTTWSRRQKRERCTKAWPKGSKEGTLCWCWDKSNSILCSTSNLSFQQPNPMVAWFLYLKVLISIKPKWIQMALDGKPMTGGSEDWLAS